MGNLSDKLLDFLILLSCQISWKSWIGKGVWKTSWGIRDWTWTRCNLHFCYATIINPPCFLHAGKKEYGTWRPVDGASHYLLHWYKLLIFTSKDLIQYALSFLQPLSWSKCFQINNNVPGNKLGAFIARCIHKHKMTLIKTFVRGKGGQKLISFCLFWVTFFTEMVG